MKTKAQDVMTKNPACCTTGTSLREVGQMMVALDCGAIPVVENQGNKKLVGIITDRDIVCRTIAQNKNPLELTAGDAMSQPLATARPQSTLEECCELMEENQVRRIPVIDDEGRCCGILTQAHIAKHADSEEVGQVVKDVSRKTKSPSAVSAS